jgi:hypothetical protein
MHAESSKQVNTSSAKCSVVAIGYSEVKNSEAIASAGVPFLVLLPVVCDRYYHMYTVQQSRQYWSLRCQHSNAESVTRVLMALWTCAVASATAAVCGDHDVDSYEEVAKATASAYALAVASASAECELQGDAYVRVDAQAHAEAAAYVWLEAYASAWAGASVCNKCSAYADSWGHVYDNVFLKAVADAHVQVRSRSNALGRWCLYFSGLLLSLPNPFCQWSDEPLYSST